MKIFNKFTAIILLSVGSLASYGLESASTENPVQITIEQGALSVHTNEGNMLRYCYENVPFKPYVQQLLSPNGVNILRDAPFDHLHHHGLMFAVAVDGVNFWEERHNPGQQAHLAFNDVKIDKMDGVPQAGFTEQIDWLNSESKESLLKEHRRLKVCQTKDIKATLLTWQSRFEVPQGKDFVTLTGRVYFGLGMRFLQSMDTGGQFYNADGKTGVEETNGEQSIWCAYTAKANSKPVTVAMFSHPNNERHPATWFTLENRFAYLSLTMNLDKQPVKIISNKPLIVRYAIALWDGRVPAEKINQLYQCWIVQPKTPIKNK